MAPQVEDRLAVREEEAAFLVVHEHGSRIQPAPGPPIRRTSHTSRQLPYELPPRSGVTILGVKLGLECSQSTAVSDTEGEGSWRSRAKDHA
jgi:hypothetical protein